jgi:hypothetical protein
MLLLMSEAGNMQILLTVGLRGSLALFRGFLRTWVHVLFYLAICFACAIALHVYSSTNAYVMALSLL